MDVAISWVPRLGADKKQKWLLNACRLGGAQVGGMVTSLLPSRGSPAREQNQKYPPPLRKHQPGQESDGQTGSWCLDRAVQPRDARYQKKACPKNLPIPHPKHNRALEHNV